MGLDAVVFRQLASLKAEYGTELSLADEETGEVDVESARLPWASAIALHYGFGNIAAIGHLREVVADILKDPHSALQTQVLYSGSHAGDVIKASAFAQIRKELEALHSASKPEIVAFAAGLEALIVCAERESNPIVFI